MSDDKELRIKHEVSSLISIYYNKNTIKIILYYSHEFLTQSKWNSIASIVFFLGYLHGHLLNETIFFFQYLFEYFSLLL